MTRQDARTLALGLVDGARAQLLAAIRLLDAHGLRNDAAAAVRLRDAEGDAEIAAELLEASRAGDTG